MNPGFFQEVDASKVDVDGEILPALQQAGQNTTSMSLNAVDTAYILEAAIERFGNWTYRLEDLKMMHKTLWYEQPYAVVSEILNRAGLADINWLDASKRVNVYDEDPGIAYRDLWEINVPLTLQDNNDLQRGRALDLYIYDKIYRSLNQFQTKAFRRNLDYSDLSEAILEQDGQIQATPIEDSTVYTWIKQKAQYSENVYYQTKYARSSSTIMKLENSSNIDPAKFKDMKVPIVYRVHCVGYEYIGGQYFPYDQIHYATEWVDGFWQSAYNAWLVQIAESGALYSKVQSIIRRLIGDEWTQASKFDIGNFSEMQVQVSMFTLQDGVSATQILRTDLSQYY